MSSVKWREIRLFEELVNYEKWTVWRREKKRYKMKAARRVSQAFDKAFSGFSNKRHTTSFASAMSAQTPSDTDLFMLTVLLNPDKHDQLLRFAFTEYNENAIFMFDAIQDLKIMEDEQLQNLAFISLFEEYVEEGCSKRVKIDNVSYQIVLQAARKPEMYCIKQAMDILEEFAVKTLMRVYGRMITPPETQDGISTTEIIRKRASVKIESSNGVLWSSFNDIRSLQLSNTPITIQTHSLPSSPVTMEPPKKKKKFSIRRLFRTHSK
jgi:hypothetical protein